MVAGAGESLAAAADGNGTADFDRLFPIEFHDIRELHRVLYGPDLVSNLEIGGAFHRAQVEHDLRARLLRLRQKASGILSDKMYCAVCWRIPFPRSASFCGMRSSFLVGSAPFAEARSSGARARAVRH